ncbi:MAG: hypothetical protein HRU40_13715 [Saprospiraceae bacterium]|nr:hypothetical protein [Saprospiraceae bacterium]
MSTSEIGLFLLFSAIAAIPLIISLRLLKKRKAQMKKLQEIKDRIIELSKEKQQNQNKKKK